LFALLSIAPLAAAETPATAPAPIRLTGINGKAYEPLTVAPHRAAVLVFVLQDCPICNGYAPQIQRLAAESRAKDVPVYLIHVDPALTPDDARKHARDYGYTIPVLIDRRHELVGRLGIGSVPTTVVLNDRGETQYEGRIDDQYVAIGKARNVVTAHDLRDALAAVLAGNPVAHPRTRAIGCAVPDLPPTNGKK
jgi:thiol-disulfide isomerase/thioredoxin